MQYNPIRNLYSSVRSLYIWVRRNKRKFNPYIRYIRPLLPRDSVYYSGRPVAVGRKGDRFLVRFFPSWGLPTDKPDYEAHAVHELSRYVCAGDTVVIIGGGVGRTALAAAECAGQQGTVFIFEPTDRADIITETMRLNRIVSNWFVRRTFVGEMKRQKFDVRGADSLLPTMLPPCSVLEMDCEGAELEILQEMQVRPRIIIVETHGHFGSSTKAVVAELEKKGYTIVNKECEKDTAKSDTYIITAFHTDSE